MHPTTKDRIDSARWDLIQHLASPHLMRWGHAGGASPHAPMPGVATVRAALARIDDALTQLGERKGERADAARAFLEAERARCADALEAVLAYCSEQYGFPGGAFDALLARYIEALRDLQAAEQARATAGSATMRAARERLDDAEGRINDFRAELAQLCERMAWPNPPAAEAFTSAEADAAALHAAAKDASKPASLLAVALDQGRAAIHEVALLHVVYERVTPKGELAKAYELRAAVHAERGQP